MDIKTKLAGALKMRPAWSGALFKSAEGLLKEEVFQAALKFVAPKERLKLYRETIDFLFCEIVTEYREACFKYYEDQGPPLSFMPQITPEKIVAWDIELATCLHIACELRRQKKQIPWDVLRDLTEAALRQA